MKPRIEIIGVVLLAVFAGTHAQASFHFMQIEQVIAGVNGDKTAQAIQLRMRSAGQGQVQNARLIARDATGSNPVVLIAFSHSVSNNAAGDRVLATTGNFANYTSPALVTDFTMTNPIPTGYLAAGRITFEDNFGTIYWSLSFGGSSYTGSTTGSTTNDADGNFGPSFAGPLPSSTLQALKFQGAAGALSTNNAADYALTAGAAVFTNNARNNFTVAPPSRTITQWRSVRGHSGGVGELGIVLDPTASCTGGGSTVETRGTAALGIGIRKVQIDFSGPVTLVSPGAITITGRTTVGGVLGASTLYSPTSAVMTDADTLEMQFLGSGPPDKLPDQSWFQMTIGTATISQSLTGDRDVEVRSLLGDATMNGEENLGDMLVTQIHLGQALTPATAQYDTDLNGIIDDLSLLKTLVSNPAAQAICGP